MKLAQKVTENTKNASWIRKMFEKGAERAAIVGAENVYDFSIGNPFLEPPTEVFASIEKHYQETGIHRYMPNAGFTDVREKVAAYHTKKNGVALTFDNVIMTSGAAGGLNIILKAILNPGEEVVVVAPYFVEYGFYVENFQGVLKTVMPDANFQLDVENIAQALTKDTKAIILNTPNNPTGVIYSEERLKQLNEVLVSYEKATGQCIYVILDEPYAEICFDGKENPNTLSIFDNPIYCNSMSKTLGLAGERAGYVLVPSKTAESKQMISNLIFANRTLGFGNANALFQKVVGDCLEARVDLAFYQKNRELLVDSLEKAGYEFVKPDGAFYVFVKVPNQYESDVAFCDAALEENILAVPGIGFGYSGYARLSFCIKTEIIEKAFASGGFKRLIEKN